jgi:multidrug efflux pump subunit AcrA (membrane-fusion protein)
MMRIRKDHAFLLAASVLAMVSCSKQGKADEPAKPEAKQAANVLTLSQESLKNIDLKTEVAKASPLAQVLKIPGQLKLDANRTAKVSATFEGKLVKLGHDLGDRVSQGAEMGLLETPELLDKPLVIRAPVAGIVTSKNAALGELVVKGQEIFTVSDPRFLWLIGEVKEMDAAQVRQGQKVEFTVSSYPDQVFRGRIARVGTVVESNSRTFEIRVEIDNRGGRLKPGMFADISIVTGTLAKALLVSDAALQSDGDNQIAFVAAGNGRFEKRTVKTGRAQGGKVQVLEGIKEGEAVVTEGSFTLKSEMLKGELGEE